MGGEGGEGREGRERMGGEGRSREEDIQCKMQFEQLNTTQ